MGDNRSYAALEWVVGEIGEALKQAQRSLEAFVENPEDTTRIRFCLTHIHQVHGSLQMVEFYGAALLAEEMENLAQALMNKTVRNEDEGHEVLMRAILQLPLYLERVKASRKDDPSTVLPLLNDLRTVRGEAMLTETKLFSPNLAPAHTVEKTGAVAIDETQFGVILHKLLKMYQYAAAGVIRNVDVQENANYLNKVFTRLRKLTQGTARQPLWDISLALLEGLTNEGIESSVSIKNLLRQLHKEIKLLAQGGLASLSHFTNDELIKNILYYIARCEVEGKHINRIRKAYNLDTALPEMDKAEKEEVLSPDIDAIRSVVSALRDELDAIKHCLDVSLTDREEADISEALPIIQRVADTMAVLGIGDLRKQIMAQGEVLMSSVNPTDDMLMQVAGQIIEIEGALEQIADGHNQQNQAAPVLNALSSAQETVLQESRNGLEKAKDAILEYIGSQWNRDHLANVPQQLREISGGLDMMPLPRPAAILVACSNYVEQNLVTLDGVPNWEALDTLADAITSVEYYLERLCGDRQEDDEELIALAADSVKALGYPVDDVLQAAAEAAARQQAQPQLQVVQNEAPVDADKEAAKVEPIKTATAEAEPEETAEQLQEPAVDDIIEITPVAEEAEPELVQAEAVAEPEPEPVAEPAVAAASAPAASVDDDLVDDEIIEIFIEEAREVIDTINEFFPQWAEDTDNRDALTEYRRGFHTLKGSGRMVNATDIGEFAWACENMLNRVIDSSVPAHRGHINLLREVIPMLPVLVDAFEARQGTPEADKIELLSNWADELEKGNMPNALDFEPGSQRVNFGDKPQAPIAEVEPVVEESPLTETESEESTVQLEEAATENVVDITAEKPTIIVDERSDDDDDDDDSVLWEIFGSEALSHLDVVEDYVAAMEASAPLYTPPSDQMQRALHTLKGSAHMADITPIAELVTPLERFVKELRIYQVNIDEDILQLIKDGVLYIRAVLTQIENREPLEIPKEQQFMARVNELRERSVAPLIAQKEEEETAKKKIDPQLLSIFMAEEMQLLLDVDDIIRNWQRDGFDLNSARPVMDELHTLEAGSCQANLPPMETLSRLLFELYEAAVAKRINIDDNFYQALSEGHSELLNMVDSVAVYQNVQPLSESVEARLSELAQASDDEVVSTIPSLSGSKSAGAPPVDFSFLNEEELDRERAEKTKARTKEEDAAETIEFEAVDDALEEFSLEIEVDGPAEEPEVAAELTEEIPENDEEILAAFDEPELVEETPAIVDEEPESVQAEEAPSIAETVAESAETQPAAVEDDVDVEIFEIFIEEAEELLEEIDESVHKWEEDWEDSSHSEALKRALHTLKGGARLAQLMGLGELAHEFESYLIQREGQDVDQELFDVVHNYQDKLINGTDKVKRAVEGQMPSGLAEVLSASESFDESALDDQPLADVEEPEELVAADENTETVAAEDDIAAEHSADELAAESAEESIAASAEDNATEASEEKPKDSPAESTATVLPFSPKPKTDKAPAAAGRGSNLPAAREFTGVQKPAATPPPATAPAARRSGPQEVVKVSAELLEELVNLAGETSISRGRLEEQNSELGFAVEEMEATVQRLQEQLRRLDIETEAQMVFRQEQMEENEDFDPLEMDRYSHLQQLSRSLMESASDLMDLTGTMSDKRRDTETLLLQQSRINTDLQEGLMRSRMVPFSRLVPRLRRIVRQISTELNKRVTFELDNVEGELDRSVLERMIAPLEHMLRNAVDHGIEDAEARAASGKPEVGRIVLSLGREGGDVIMRLADDGRGLNLDRIREKAIERRLMSKDAVLSDHDIMQFILTAGFSTADKVTQISGRGVGMDVVHSEIKQLGGAMFIDSRWGQGTEFIIRLPFTVSVNRALMIQIGDDNYAIPLNTIEGIVRVSPFELEHYYQDPNAHFEYANEHYQVRYLGSMLDENIRPRLEGQALPMPVVLVRTTEHTMAVQVDRLMGSREIVVKNLGPQFSAVEGLSGATVMGDGSVVVILDLHAMIRKEMALAAPAAQFLELEPTEDLSNKVKTVLVVDDSVTVRKVTSRFLEREGFEVLTAKDGADALLALQDQMPDLMLLDIEMPRMDGFEVAKNIRSSSRLKDLPIIMITSRTGDKHRERALGLGVDKYMGKPYQEDILLANINELIERE